MAPRCVGESALDHAEQPVELAGGFVIKTVSTTEFTELTAKPMERVFDASEPVLRLRDHLSEDERRRVQALRDRMGDAYRINLVAFHGDALAGWCFGYQESALIFYMCNSAVLPEFRRRG